MAKLSITDSETSQLIQLVEQFFPGANLTVAKEMLAGVSLKGSNILIEKTFGTQNLTLEIDIS